MQEFSVSPESLDRGAMEIGRGGDQAKGATDGLLAGVSDLAVFGTNDTLGGVCQMIYSVFLETFTECAHGLEAGATDQQDRVRLAADCYRATEADHVALADDLRALISDAGTEEI